MILKSITLENIRSFQGPTTIDFQPGTTLFEGDVAAGKSTILSAIEFALFGLGDLNGSFLLRNGSASGHVILAFEVDRAEYRVHRSLTRKGENVRSGDSFIEEGGEKAKLATKELKERVLSILKFNEPSNPKAQSVIYRFAIFTPQEAMRDIIERDSGTRLETLRKAYGIEQYKTAAQNTKTVSAEFRFKVERLKGRIGDLDGDRKKLVDCLTRIGELRAGLEAAKKRKEALDMELESARARREELRERKDEIGRAQDRIPLLSRQLHEKEQQRKAALKETESAAARVADLAKDIARLEAVRSPTAKDQRELEEESRGLEKEIASRRDQISRHSERLKNFNDLLETGVCPVCEREYEADRVSERRSHIEGELAVMNREAQGLEDQKKTLDDAIDQLRDYNRTQGELKPLVRNVAEWKERGELGVERAETLTKEIADLNEQFRQANKISEPIQKILKEIEKVDGEIGRVEEEHSSAVKTLGRMENELEKSQADAERLSTEIKEREGLQRQQGALEEDQMWLTDYLAPSIELIEKQTFANRNERFNQQFKRWFQVLVDDPDLRVRVTEDFSPVIEREGYEQDYRQLSGGERTSVALAYRLALNTTVQEAALGQEPNLLILDEPTDGFSKEQLGKFGDILNELKCPQVILVSHERELESVADRVFMIEKINGDSTVSVVESYRERSSSEPGSR